MSLLLLAFLSAVPVQAAPSWKIQIVDENGAMGGNGRIYPIAVDSNNNPHLVYLSPYSDSKVTYASSNGLSWSTQTITGGNAFSLVLDDNDNPHIMYTGLTYAYWTGSNWTTQTVDPTAPNAFAALALDSFGNPHVAYTDHTVVKYARWTGSNWNIQTVDTHSEIPYRLSLALDSNNTPYITYDFTISIPTGTGNYQSIEKVKLATLQNSKWHIQTIAYSGDFGNMVLDSKGYPHMIYRIDHSTHFTNSTLVYAHWDEKNWWTTQAVVSNVRLDNVGFLALDSNDYPHISYIGRAYNPEIGGDEYFLRYTRWTGTAWNTLSVNTTRRAVGPCYLALDSDGNPHISYRTFHPTHYKSVYIMYATATIPDTQPSQPLNVSIVSPENKTYSTTEVPLTFTASKQASSIYYSVNGEANVSITGNTTLTNLTNGTHNLTIYAEDNNGNTGASETIQFTISKEDDTTPASSDSTILLVSAAIIIGAVITVVYVWRKVK